MSELLEFGERRMRLGWVKRTERTKKHVDRRNRNALYDARLCGKNN